MKTTPESPKFIPIARESAFWMTLAVAAATVGPAIERKVTGEVPQFMQRTAKVLGGLGLMRAGHAATEYIHPGGEPSPHLGQILTNTILEPVIERVHAAGEHIHDYVTA